MTGIAPVVKYPGAKHRLAGWISSHFPRHRVYLEPFAGSLAVLFNKPRSPLETVNDLNHDVVTLFSVVRDQPEALAHAVQHTAYARAEYDAAWAEPHHPDPVEDARRFLIRSWMGHSALQGRKGGWIQCLGQGAEIHSRARYWAAVPDRIMAAVERLRGVQIECRPALTVIAQYHHQDTLIYADPPYPHTTRHELSQYAHEMTLADHEALLDALDAHPGPVVLSSYRNELYDTRLAHWQRHEITTRANYQAQRTEVIWCNRPDTLQQPLKEYQR